MLAGVKNVGGRGDKGKWKAARCTQGMNKMLSSGRQGAKEKGNGGKQHPEEEGFPLPGSSPFQPAVLVNQW